MQLFRERLIREWRLHMKLAKDVMDWTTFLYALIPTGAFLYFLYRETMLKGEFGFFAYIPVELLVVILIFLGGIGYMRTFIEAADRLFLIQHRHAFTMLKRLSVCYSIIWQTLYIVLGLLLLLPVLAHHYELPVGEIMLLGAAMLLFFLLNRCLEWSNLNRWFKDLAGLMVAVVLSIVVLYASGIGPFLIVPALILVLLFMDQRHIRTGVHFEKQLEYDLKAHTRWISRLFFFNNEVKSMMKEHHTVKAPRFLKGRLFKHAASELLLKTIIRNKRYRWGYIRLVAITIPLYLALPFWADVLLLGFSYFMLTGWLESVMYEVKGHAVFSVLKLQDEQWNASLKKTKAIFVVPVLLFMGGVVVLGILI